MGYVLNDLANLPVDDNIHFYIFVVNGQYIEPLYEIMEQNFMKIAADIGRRAVIAVGTDRKNFTTSVAKTYLGKGNSDREFMRLLPALLITNEHPERLNQQSMRLVVPLAHAEERMGGWHQFFDALGRFARGEDDDFLHRFENREDFLNVADRIVELKPGMFGMSININELLKLAAQRIADRRAG